MGSSFWLRVAPLSLSVHHYSSIAVDGITTQTGKVLPSLRVLASILNLVIVTAMVTVEVVVEVEVVVTTIVLQLPVMSMCTVR